MNEDIYTDRFTFEPGSPIAPCDICGHSDDHEHLGEFIHEDGTAENEDITERFDNIQVTAEGMDTMGEVRDHFKAIALILDPMTAGRARAVALTELESAHRAVNRAIAESNRA